MDSCNKCTKKLLPCMTKVSNLAWLEAMHKEVDDEDARGDEEAALCLVQLHARGGWGFVGHVQWHCWLEPQARRLCRGLCGLLHVTVIPGTTTGTSGLDLKSNDLHKLAKHLQKVASLPTYYACNMMADYLGSNLGSIRASSSFKVDRCQSRQPSTSSTPRCAGSRLRSICTLKSTAQIFCQVKPFAMIVKPSS